jgi:hypothetical protein
MRRLRVGSNVQDGFAVCAFVCSRTGGTAPQHFHFPSKPLGAVFVFSAFDSAYRRATSVGQAQFERYISKQTPRAIHAHPHNVRSHSHRRARSRTFKVTLPIGDQQPEFLDSTETLCVCVLCCRVCVSEKVWCVRTGLFVPCSHPNSSLHISSARSRLSTRTPLGHA